MVGTYGYQNSNAESQGGFCKTRGIEYGWIKVGLCNKIEGGWQIRETEG